MAVFVSEVALQTVDLHTGLAAAAWRENTIGTLYEMAKRAPGQALSLDFGTRQVLLLQDAEHIRHVLRTNPNAYQKNFGGFRALFGESRLTADGERWEFLQKLSQPHINVAPIREVGLSAYAAFSAAAADLLEAGATGKTVDVDGPANRASARVASDVVFGFHDLDIDQVLDDFRAVLRHGGSRNWNFDGAMTDTPPQRQRLAEAKRRLSTVVQQLIGQAAERGVGSDLVSDIAAAGSLGVDALSEICTLLFAGFDTTSTAVSWALFLLAAAPDLQRHLRAEIREAGFSGEAPEAAGEIGDLVAFQNEVMRIFPPVPVLGRIAVATDSISDIAVSVGQVVLISLIGLHHDARYFASPAHVRLKRYVDGQLSKTLRGHLLPFGDGKRVCGGGRLANIELTVALATLIDRIEVNIAESEPIKFDWTASLRRAGGQWLLTRPAS